MAFFGDALEAIKSATGDNSNVVTGLNADVLDEVQFQKQCFLSYNLLDIIEKADPVARAIPAGPNERRQALGDGAADIRRGQAVAGLSYGSLPRSQFSVGGQEIDPIPSSPQNFSVIRGAFPSDITSLIVGHPEISKLIDQKPYLLSFFVPYVRIYKVVNEWDLARSNLPEAETEPLVFGGQDPIVLNSGIEPGGELESPLSNRVIIDQFREQAGLEAGSRAGGTVEIEFLFDHKTNKEDIRMMMESRRGRAGGVGLKSFSWEFLGVNPAEVENNIKASLGFYFNDINEFDRPREAANLQGVGATYRFSDLIIAEPLRNVSADSPGIDAARDNFNPDHFRLKVVVGWNLKPKNEIISDVYENEDYDALVQLAKDSRKVLYLTLLRHDLNFNQDGSVELNAEYQAYAESVFNHPASDILNVRPRPGGQTEQTQRTYDELGNSIRALSDVRSNCGTTTQTEEVQNTLDQAGAVKDAVQDELLLEQRKDRSYAYQSILNRLFLSNRIYTIVAPIDKLGLGSRQQVLDAATVRTDDDGNVTEAGSVTALTGIAPQEDPNGQPDVQEENEEGTEAGAAPPEDPTESREAIERRVARDGDLVDVRRLLARRRYLSQDDFSVQWYGQPTGYDYDAAPVDNSAAELVDQSLIRDFSSPEEYDNFVQAQIQGLQQRLEWSRLPNAGRETITFDFMFFGDILDIVLMNCTDWLTDSNISLFLGTFPYHDPKLIDRFGINEASVLPVSLAYIPISLELFSMWFLEEIVEPQLNRMSLQRFMRSVFDKLIINSFSSDCVYDPSGLQSLAQEGLSVIPQYYEILKRNMQYAKMDTATMDRMEVHDPTTEPGYLPRIFQPSIGPDRAEPEEGVTQIQIDVGLGAPITAGTALNPDQLEEEANSYLERYQGNTIEYNSIKDLDIPLLGFEEGTQYDDYIHMLLYQDQAQDHNFGDLFDRIDYGAPDFIYSEQVEQDAARGVYHLNLGSDRGLVKQIEFNRIDQEGVIEARIEAAGELGAFDQLRERYNATVTMYGNSFFYPGQHVFINPSMVGINSVPDRQAMTTKLGLGGYFVIIKVENVIESGLYETILDCSWVYSGFKVNRESRDCPDRQSAIQQVTEELARIMADRAPEPSTPVEPEDPEVNTEDVTTRATRLLISSEGF